MMRPSAVVALAALTLASTATGSAAAGEPPNNILIILADDLGVDALGAYGLGAQVPPTPNIDAMCAEGVMFRNVWSNPVCTATRATILTGRYSFRTGMGFAISPYSPSLPLEEVTLPEMLTFAPGGPYDTAAIGKWHLNNSLIDPVTWQPQDPGSGQFINPNLAGFSHFSGNMSVMNGSYSQWAKVENGVLSTEPKHNTVDTVDEALTWLGTAKEPWLLYLPFNTPHRPYETPPNHLHSSTLASGSTPASGEDPRPYFNAMVEAMDTEIGRLLASMNPAVRARTTTMFLGDNGSSPHVVSPPFDPDHSKLTVFDGGVNVPMIVTGPLVTAPGTECKGLINTTDIFATAAEIAGVDLTPAAQAGLTLDSVSFIPYLSNPALPTIRPYVFAEQFRPNATDDMCQIDLGGGGPGTVEIRLCGAPLTKTATALLELTGAPPAAPILFVTSTSYQPKPCWGGYIGPYPSPHVWPPVFAGPNGTLSLPVSGSDGTSQDQAIYFQTAVADGAQPEGVALSNVLQVVVPSAPTQYHVVAIRNQRFKLIRILEGNAHQSNVYSAQTELFYDLLLDRFELNNLLTSGPLTPSQKAHYEQLDKWLVTLDPHTF